MTIRNANTTDISTIQNLAEKTWWPTYSPILTNEQIRYMLDLIYSTEALTRVMEDGSQQFILLSDERGEQAFAAYGPRKEEKSVSKLHKIYVLPDNQGKGYGKVLINEIIQRILKENNHALDLNVNRYNPAISFYQKLGFQVIREENIAIGPYWMNDFVMRKEI